MLVDLGNEQYIELVRYARGSSSVVETHFENSMNKAMWLLHQEIEHSLRYD